MNKKALTLLEILISTVILALVMTGLVNLFVAGKRHIAHSRSRMASGELGKLFLDPLQMKVRQDTWNDPALNCLGTGGCPNQIIGIAQGVDRDYTATYTINNGQPIANLNRVTVTITWTEPTS